MEQVDVQIHIHTIVNESFLVTFKSGTKKNGWTNFKLQYEYVRLTACDACFFLLDIEVI